jgi:hypothetical protein
MPEWGSSGSVRGDTSNGVPYRDRSPGSFLAKCKTVASCHALALSSSSSIFQDAATAPHVQNLGAWAAIEVGA